MATETEQAGNSLKEDFSAEAVAKKHKFTLKAEGGTQQFNAVAVPPYYTPDEVMGPQGGELVGAAQVVRALADFEYGFLNRKAVRAQDIDAYAIEPDEDVEEARETLRMIAGDSQAGIALSMFVAATEGGQEMAFFLIEDQQRERSLLIGGGPMDFGKNANLAYIDSSREGAPKKINAFLKECAFSRNADKPMQGYRDYAEKLSKHVIDAYASLSGETDWQVAKEGDAGQYIATFHGKALGSDAVPTRIMRPAAPGR